MINTSKITVKRATGINQQLMANANIYPNPAQNKITIQSKIKITEVDIFDLSGKRIKNFKVDRRNLFDINVQPIQSGTYIIRIYSNDNCINQLLLIE